MLITRPCSPYRYLTRGLPVLPQLCHRPSSLVPSRPIHSHPYSVVHIHMSTAYAGFKGRLSFISPCYVDSKGQAIVFTVDSRLQYTHNKAKSDTHRLPTRSLYWSFANHQQSKSMELSYQRVPKSNHTSHIVRTRAAHIPHESCASALTLAVVT